MLNDTLTKKPYLSKEIILSLILFLGATFFFSNGVYLFICLITIMGIFYVLWRNNRPGIVVFCLAMQWLQVVTFVIWMNVSDVPIDWLSPHAGIAIIMSCLGLLTIGLVMAGRINGLPIPTNDDLAFSAAQLNEKKVLTLYIGSTLFLGGIGFIFGNTSGFAQILITLSSLKWIFFMLYGYVIWIKGKRKFILVLIILFEFTTSLYSYFSSFKEVFLFAIIFALSFIKRVSFKQFVYSILIAVLLGGFMITWNAIKGDYRQYLNAGTHRQVVSVSRGEAFDKIGQELSDLTWARYQQAINLSLYRLQYIYHFARTMDRVPAVLPYENGQLWLDNISYVLVPRLFNPDKPIFDATIKTNKYTGLNYSGLKQGASFSLGYFVDGYIDFGYVGMLLPLVFMGLFVSLIYRTFYKMRRLNILLRFSIINTSLYTFIFFESDAIYMFGRLLITFLVFWAMSKFVFPYLQSWLYKK